MEIAFSLQRLMDECDVTQETVAQRVGKKRSTVANYLRLLQLPPEVQAALKSDTISMGHAKAIAAAEEDIQLHLLKRVIKKGLSVRATEELAKKFAAADKAKPAATEEEEYPETYTRLVESLAHLSTEDVRIKRRPAGGVTLTIGFDTDDQLAAFAAKIDNIK